MNNIYSDNKRMKRLYKSPKEGMYNHRFFEDLCSGYSFTLGEKSNNLHRNFLTFEPKECLIANLLNKEYHYDLSYDLEKTICQVIYSLLAFGKAFIYLLPEYSESQDEGGKIKKELSSLRIGEIKGFIKKHNKEHVIFCRKGFDNELSDVEMPTNQLIEFSLKELGYRKKYFVNILKKLNKCDALEVSTLMLANNTEGYDFSFHTKKRKMQELKAIKSVGWSFGTDYLSDSYILYKKIKEDKLKIQFLRYIVGKLNCGFDIFFGKSEGLLVAHIKEKDYEQMWNDYLEGKTTGSELSNILYNV